MKRILIENKAIILLRLLFILPILYGLFRGFELDFFAVYGICIIIALCYFEYLTEAKSDSVAIKTVKQNSHPPEKKSESLNLLSNEINPHFLYNTLESIRGKAMVDGADEVAEMTETLSAFFRYSISRRSNVVHLKDELNNIQEYMKIQRFRFDNRFSMDVIIEGSPSIIETQIPKLTLQPLVENAIVHGLEVRAKPGKITIRIQQSQNMLDIYVQDDGVGIDSDKLKQINSSLNLDQITGLNNHDVGIALHNINARIKLLYGTDYGLHVFSTKGIGTTVEVTLPCIQKTM